MPSNLDYLTDAAKQLEAAARRLRQAANGHEYAIVRRRLLREALTNMEAARLRATGAQDDPDINDAEADDRRMADDELHRRKP